MRATHPKPCWTIDDPEPKTLAQAYLVVYAREIAAFCLGSKMEDLPQYIQVKADVLALEYGTRVDSTRVDHRDWDWELPCSHRLYELVREEGYQFVTNDSYRSDWVFPRELTAHELAEAIRQVQEDEAGA